MPLLVHWFHRLKIRIKPPTLRNKLSPKPITSPLRKKSKIIFRSQIVDSKEDEEQTYLHKMGGVDCEEFQTTV